jgi:hypothetical protein
MMHLDKIRKGIGKWETMVLEIFNVKQIKGYFLKKSARYIREDIYTARTIGRIIDLNHGINLSAIDTLRTAENGRSTHQKYFGQVEPSKHVIGILKEPCLLKYL